MAKLPEKTPIKLFAQGEYIMEFVDIYTEDDKGVSYEIDGKQRARWVFKVLEALDDDPLCEEEVGGNYSFFTSFLLSPKSKMNEYLEALLGREIELGETPDDDELAGKRVRVFVEHYTKSMGPNAGQPGDRVGKMITYKPKKRRAEVDDDEEREPVAAAVNPQKNPDDPF